MHNPYVFYSQFLNVTYLSHISLWVITSFKIIGYYWLTATE